MSSLAALKNLIGPLVQKETLGFSLLPDGCPKGAITEVVGSGKTEFVLALLAEHPQLKVAWVEENLSIYPVAFLQRNVSLNRVLFVESGRETCWCALQALKAQIFQVVVLYAENLKLAELRKIQLAAEKSQALVFWLTARPQSLWPVSLQVEVRRVARESALEGRILRRRY